MHLEDRAIARRFRTDAIVTAPTKFRAPVLFGGNLTERRLREQNFLRQQG